MTRPRSVRAAGDHRRLGLAAAGLATVLSAALAQPAPAPDAAAPALNPGHLLYDEARRRLLMLAAHRTTEVPDRAQLWAWTTDRWRLLPAPDGPAMRTLSGAVYDSRRHRVVLYGGLGKRGLADPRSDTWEWDGRTWTQASDVSVGSRDHHAMAFDASRARTVMFGGVSSVVTPQGTSREFPGDTWEWDGARWHRFTEPGPSPRGGAVMVFDRARRVVVLFGGVALAPGAPARHADTWTWDGRRWRQVAGEGPPARNGHAMVFDRRTNAVLLWGGTTGASHLDDLWRWDGRRWTAIEVRGDRPSPRTGAQLIDDTARGRIVLFGGRMREGGTVRTSNDMWEWDGRVWTRVPATAPAAAR